LRKASRAALSCEPQVSVGGEGRGCGRIAVRAIETKGVGLHFRRPVQGVVEVIRPRQIAARLVGTPVISRRPVRSYCRMVRAFSTAASLVALPALSPESLR
jgi:hypothetical protein